MQFDDDDPLSVLAVPHGWAGLSRILNMVSELRILDMVNGVRILEMVSFATAHFCDHMV